MYRKTPFLMEIVVRRENLETAIQSVKRNKGAAGIDGMTVFEIEEHIKKYYIPLRNKLLEGSYQSKPVKRVEIPKANGKKRKLGVKL